MVAPLPQGRRRVGAARGGRDAHDGRHPVAHRPRHRPHPRGRQGGPDDARDRNPRRRRVAPGAHGGPALDRGTRVAGRRARPAQPHVRAPAGARARLLRSPADRPAHVARDRRPPGRALLPGLWPRLHPAVGAHHPARRHRHVRRAARAGGRLAHPGADRGLRLRALRPALAARPRPALQELQQRIAELTADVEENIGGVRVVKAFAREDRQLVRFRGRVGRVWDQAMVSTRMQAFYNPFIGFLPQIGLAAILFIGGRQVIDGRLTIGEFSAFYAYLLMLLSPMRTLGTLLGLSQRATAAGARVYQILDREPGIVSPPGAPALPPGSGHVELRGVSLEYDGAARPVLHDVDLDVAAGSTVALVGATGSGKTTLVQLLPRLYDVTAGAVLIDGADVRAVDVASLRSAIAVVDDDPFLFSATVAENIAYGRADATREEIETAARRAQAHDFIARLPEGYDTRVGERGLTLSGGQRQRVAIARAF